MPYKTMNCKYCPCKFVRKSKKCRWQNTRLFYKDSPISYFYYLCPRCETKHTLLFDTPVYNESYIKVLVAKNKEEREEDRNSLDEIRREIERELRL